MAAIPFSAGSTLSSTLFHKFLPPVMAVAASRRFKSNTHFIESSEEVEGAKAIVRCDKRVSRSSIQNAFDGLLSIFEKTKLPPKGGGSLTDIVAVDDAGLHLRMEMPGILMAHMEYVTDQDALSIIGEGAISGTVYCRVKLPPMIFNFDQIKAERKTGLLEIFIPLINYYN